MTAKGNYAVDILTYVWDHQHRVEAAWAKRAEVQEAIRQGRTDLGYRVKFMIDAAGQLVDYMGDLATQFNKLYADDILLKQDARDILMIVAHRLGVLAKEGEADFDPDVEIDTSDL